MPTMSLLTFAFKPFLILILTFFHIANKDDYLLSLQNKLTLIVPTKQKETSYER